jgi:hypothetical protein
VKVAGAQRGGQLHVERAVVIDQWRPPCDEEAREERGGQHQREPEHVGAS